MAHPAEKKIKTPSNLEVYRAIRKADSEKTDVEIIADLMRIIVFVAVCYNDVIEDGQSPTEVFDRQIFVDCDELAGFFPWPED